MCTVTYLPENNAAFILTSNRDEGRLRKIALPPQKYLVHGVPVYFPKDTDSYGTWFAAEATQFTLCLLNGAFERHQHHPPYRLSRGLMLLDFFKYCDVHDFISQYDFTGIEPFTLLVIEKKSMVAIHEIRWDEKKIYFDMKDATVPHIWSSVQLYPKEVIRQREQWFAEWLTENKEFSMEKILLFHKTAGTGDESSNLLMNRGNKVYTVSITSLERTETKSMMRYEDMISKKGETELLMRETL